jgi:hypothetical protein
MRGVLIVLFSVFAANLSAPAQTHSPDSSSALARANDDASASNVTHPPKAKREVIEESLHGVTIRDPYRCLASIAWLLCATKVVALRFAHSTHSARISRTTAGSSTVR